MFRGNSLNRNPAASWRKVPCLGLCGGQARDPCTGVYRRDRADMVQRAGAGGPGCYLPLPVADHPLSLGTGSYLAICSPAAPAQVTLEHSGRFDPWGPSQRTGQGRGHPRGPEAGSALPHETPHLTGITCTPPCPLRHHLPVLSLRPASGAPLLCVGALPYGAHQCGGDPWPAPPSCLRGSACAGPSLVWTRPGTRS